MIHGGDLLSYKEFYDGDLVDFSSNINPLGYPQGLEAHLVKSFSSLLAYPDIKYRRLKENLSDYLGCQEESLVLGNGSVELIDGFISLFERVLVFTPSFYEYEARTKVHGKALMSLSYNKDFEVDLEDLSLVKKRDLLILGNPNNPTGLRIKEERLRAIYEVVVEKEAFLLLDEAFYEFTEGYDSIKLFKGEEYRNLAILRASTKFFGLPGLRLGYGVTSSAMARRLEGLLLPWNINSLAEAAGDYIFKDRTYIEKSRAYVKKERNFLSSGIEGLESFKVFSSESNFLLVRLLACDEDKAFNHFLSQGLIIRKCSSFRGLDKSYIRVAVKDRENNKRLLNAFRSLDDYLRKSPASL